MPKSKEQVEGQKKEQTETRKPAGSERVLQHAAPSVYARFVQPVVIKQGSVFLLCTDDGDIRADSDQGLYFHDMRYLSVQTLRLNGVPPVSLLADASAGYRGLFELTNPDIQDESGQLVLRKETLGIRREKCLGDDFVEVITIRNFVPEPAELTLHLSYRADFADMFMVRGTQPGKRGTLREPAWHGSALRFEYDGADQHRRLAMLRFSQPPDERHAGDVAYHVRLPARKSWELKITCEIRDEKGGPLESRPYAGEGSRVEDQQHAHVGALGSGTRVETDNPLFNHILARSFLDLHMLRMRQKGHAFFAAGVPWYVALFGRDSLVTSMETVAFEPEISANTLRVLASYQGTKVDDWRDEQPGKILHEMRVDEMANLDEIPQTPYYGSVDSTPLFLVLLGIYSAWVGSLDLFRALRANVQAALAWIDQYGDSDGDGFIDYQTRSKSGNRNQGWKDSGNGIVMENGQLAEPPIALPEVQGEVYLAWSSMADLFERDGDGETAEKLRQRAKRLFEAFNDAFWLDDTKYYAFCRQADGTFSKSVASNPAQALWTGIVAPRHAADVVQRVLQPDMFAGWGVRTLSAQDASYNPVDYQVGSVWPHDNAIIMAGLHRYGFNDEAGRIFTAMMQAAAQFEHFRLPEVFAGYDQSYSSKPVKYPVACNPQAWAAGAIPFMLQVALGLSPDAFNQRLHIQRPHLPQWLRWVMVRELRVGEAKVDLRYEQSDGKTYVTPLRQHGALSITVEY